MTWATPWHRESYDRFLFQTLPLLLADRLPLAGYDARPAGERSCSVQLSIAGRHGYVDVTYELPYADADGVFVVDGEQRVVLPVADSAELDSATLRCAGELLHDELAERLGDAASTLRLDQALLHAWLPLDEWVAGWIADPANAAALDDTNWLSRVGTLRRIRVAGDPPPVARGQNGRVCPIETPEGPNIGRYLHLAAGAAIQDGRIVVLDDSPAAALGASASMIPLIEHSEPARLLMGANMLRQWLLPPDPEPALVRSGAEPDAPAFWAGRNLLTAWLPWGEGATFDDGIVVSQSAARRLAYPEAADIGDKLSTRHGVKGVIARILPDAEMPMLADGTPVELVFSSLGLISRMNFGQLRETVMGRIAQVEGRATTVRPFEAPSDDTLRARLAAAGLAQDGMEQLLAPDGTPLGQRSTVGPVYWGKLYHRAATKLRVWLDAGGVEQGTAEWSALHAAGAEATIDEHFNTLALGREDTPALRVARGTVEPAGPPAPRFAELTRKLAAAGIATGLDGTQVGWSFGQPGEHHLALAEPLLHPWLRDRQLTAVGVEAGDERAAALVAANERLRRMRAGAAPPSLLQRAGDELRERLAAYLDGLVQPADLRLAARTLFTARAVIAPGPELGLDELTLPDELAWRLFGPLAERSVGAAAVAARDERASAALDEAMAGSWVVVYRMPALEPTAFLGFRPRRAAEAAIRVPLAACALLDADFDGDQVAVFLPLTEAGQRDAAERLSIAGHTRRDPELVVRISPRIEALWGLAALSLEAAGAAWLEQTLGAAGLNQWGFTDKRHIGEALRASLVRDGLERTLERVEQLWRRGFAAACAAGVSIGPFFGANIPPLPQPSSDDEAAWSAYLEERREQLLSQRDWHSELGVMLLSSLSGARGNGQQILRYLGARGPVQAVDGVVVIRHGFREGLTPRELFALADLTRMEIGVVHREMGELERQAAEPQISGGLGVLARARRSRFPGIVFAHAAASGEADPLDDAASRTFVGLR